MQHWKAGRWIEVLWRALEEFNMMTGDRSLIKVSSQYCSAAGLHGARLDMTGSKTKSLPLWVSKMDRRHEAFVTGQVVVSTNKRS